MDALEPGAVAFDLSLAGSWARGATRRLPGARLAGPPFEPEHWDNASDAMAAVLSINLALRHTQLVAFGAPWLETRPPLELQALADLLRRSEQFRDALMHFDDKTSRPMSAVEQARAEAAARRGVPYGRVVLSFGFDANGAELYAPVGRRGRAAMTRVTWSELEGAALAIEAWALDLFRRWDDVYAQWASYMERARG